MIDSDAKSTEEASNQHARTSNQCVRTTNQCILGVQTTFPDIETMPPDTKAMFPDIPLRLFVAHSARTPGGAAPGSEVPMAEWHHRNFSERTSLP